MNAKIFRSVLIVPANVPRFVEKACLRGADAIVLDLEDSVPPEQKKDARNDLEKAISLVGKGNAQVMVRINNDPQLLESDLEAAVCKRTNALFVPKVESPEQVVRLNYMIKEIEAVKGLDVGKIKFSIHIESPLALLALEKIVLSSDRIESVSLGVDDYCFAMGIDLTKDALALLFPMSQLIMVAKAHGIVPIGVLGSVAEYKNLQDFKNSAEKARDLGSEGSICVHPDQVGILNRVFSPSGESLSEARRIKAVFEEAVQTGRASTTLDGRMVDTPIYKRALAIIERSEVIARHENLKQ